MVFGMPLSMYSFLGIILLIGIVKKNGIMIVDFALENMRLRGMNAKEAIIDACFVRFRPIMMTTMAAIFGVLPIALGYGANAEARRRLGLVDHRRIVHLSADHPIYHARFCIWDWKISD